MAKKKTGQSADEIRSEITKQMVDAIKNGTPPWRRTWVCSQNFGAPCNFTNQRRYSGINPLILTLVGLIKGYGAKNWGSASAWLKHVGVHVKKGEKATSVVFFRMIALKDKQTGEIQKTASGKEKSLPLMRRFPLFHVDQMQVPSPEMLLGIPNPYTLLGSMLGQKTKRTAPVTKEELLVLAGKYLSKRDQPKEAESREVIAAKICEGIQQKLDTYKLVGIQQNADPDFAPAERLILATNAKIKYGGGKAEYIHPPFDKIHMPDKHSFETKSDFYQTMFHELAHWVINGGRIPHEGEQSYAFFELVAEIASCFTLTELGVPLAKEMVHKSQSYVTHWLEKMGSDPKYIFSASTLASKISDYLLAFVGKANPASDYDETEDNLDDSPIGHEMAA